ncbi:general stress protein [Superficieibacter sp. 1612_C1]|uniref:general stress protein n=1 Tax=Superficieibacter sp. 1612_C1 TaxID=2780382 RepID=UPI001884456D|nr:general stress protein [Superficieibacter sp. 1612_C1]
MAEHRGGSGNFAEDREKASEAGKKGGQQSGGKSGGNFANDREKASEAGKKGGQQSHGGGRK